MRVAAGLASERRDLDWLVGLVEARDSKPGPRGPYKKRRRGPGGDDGGSDPAGAGVQAVEVEVQDVDSSFEDGGFDGDSGDDEQVVYEESGLGVEIAVAACEPRHLPVPLC